MTTFLNEDDIDILVLNFYAVVRQDALLGPIFASKIPAGHWEAHMAHIASFWCSIFLKSREFQGNPMQKHLAINDITPAHFTRWLSLFQTTAHDVLPPDKAKLVYDMAQRIGQSLQMGIAFNRDKAGETDHAFSSFSLRRP